MQIVKDISQADLIVHSGVFHGDDVMVAAILSIKNRDLKVARVPRWPINGILIKDKCIVADIGGGEFDHHQQLKINRSNGVPYAAAGKVWRKYGADVVQFYYLDTYLVNLDNETTTTIMRMVDASLIQGIDAVDNGVYPAPDYPCTPLSISRIISSMNPNWNSTSSADERFLAAVALAVEVLQLQIANAAANCLAASTVHDAIRESKNGVMVLDRYVSWQGAFFKAPSDIAPLTKEIGYVVYPSSRDLGCWNVYAVPEALGSLTSRIQVPDSWKGLSGEKLEKESGIFGAYFCHKDGFIAGVRTKEGAIAFAEKAIELYTK